MRTYVAQLVLTFRLAKYPLSLQITPVSQRFSFDTPIDGLIEPFIRHRFSAYLPDESLRTLQHSRDSDKAAQLVVISVNAEPNLNRDAWTDQIRKRYPQQVEMFGFEQWRRTHGVMNLAGCTKGKLAARGKYADDSKLWPRGKGLLTMERARTAHAASAREADT